MTKFLQDPEDRTCIIKMKILEARNISSLKPQKEIFHKPHVKVEMIGEFGEDSKVWNTKDKQNLQLNGFHPIWNQTLESHLVANKDMAFLEFTLTEVNMNLTGKFVKISNLETNQFGDSSSLAFCTAKLSEIRNGVRSLALRNERGQKYPLAVILLDISVLTMADIWDRKTHCKSALQVSYIDFVVFE